MSRLRQLSGAGVIGILESVGFEVDRQKGSHIKLRRAGIGGKEVLSVPNHKQLDTGTCRAVFRQTSQHISEEDFSSYSE